VLRRVGRKTRREHINPGCNVLDAPRFSPYRVLGLQHDKHLDLQTDHLPRSGYLDGTRT
jgi:hypothetical protein